MDLEVLQSPTQSRGRHSGQPGQVAHGHLDTLVSISINRLSLSKTASTGVPRTSLCIPLAPSTTDVTTHKRTQNPEIVLSAG